MNHIFNTLIDSFIENKVGIAEHFITDALAINLKNNLTQLYQQNQLQLAGIGNNAVAIQNKLMRSDVIYWLDRKHNDPFENEFFDLMDGFVSHLNETCYTGITNYEFHYTLYETGSFYRKHIDQFRNDTGRKFSMIIYLNSNWQQGDGGSLCIHQNNTAQNIAPIIGRSVFFKSSEMEHEVLITHKPRMSITGWLKTN